MDPTTLFYNNPKEELGTLFRNQLIQKFFIIKKTDFENESFMLRFDATKDPKVNSPVNLTFKRKDFIKI